VGYARRIQSGRSMNLSIGAGLNRDAPRVQVNLRLPID
jgi:hypothetical protein